MSKTLDVAGTYNNTIRGAIAGSLAADMALTKIGLGTLTLDAAAASTCAGATTVNAGNLNPNYSNLSVANSHGTL